MKTLNILRGLPGAGKSTLAKQLGGIHLEADMYFIDPITQEYKWDANRIKHAHEWCLNLTQDYMVGNHDITVSNTFTTEKELEPYLKLAEKYGYKVICLIVENRHGNKNIHNVPEEILDIMEKRFTFKLR